MEFDHIGVPAAAKRDGMRFLESKRLWLTSPARPPLPGGVALVRARQPRGGAHPDGPHVAYLVDSLEDAMEGKK